MVLQINDKAPFIGVLVPEPNYRQYKINEELNKYLQTRLLDIEDCVKEENKTNVWVYGLTGVILGLTVGSLILH